MTHWAYTHLFTYTVGITLAIYCTQTVQPHLLPYLSSGPIPPHFMTQWAYTHSFTYTVSTTLAIYCTECPASLPPLLVQWAHTSSFYDTVGLYPLIYLHSEHHPHHLLYTDCPASFPLSFAQWAHTSSFMTWWAYAPAFSYTLGTTLESYSTQTVQTQFLPY